MEPKAGQTVNHRHGPLRDYRPYWRVRIRDSDSLVLLAIEQPDPAFADFHGLGSSFGVSIPRCIVYRSS
jgi:hypothetical protein